MNEKVIYTQKAPDKSNALFRLLAFCVLALVAIVFLFVVSMLPYSGVLTLVVYALSAWGVYKLLKNTTFDITYTLYEDKLVFMRKYGRMSWEGEVFPFDEAEFYPDRIKQGNKIYKFYPDDKLKELLHI